MPSFTPQRIRLRIDTESNKPLVDARAGNKTPQFWRGTDIQFELGFFAGSQPLDPVGLQSVTLEVHETQTSSTPPLFVLSAASAELAGGLTETDWKAGDAANIVLPATAAETNVGLLGKASRTLWLVVHAIGAGGQIYTLGAGAIIAVEDNAGNGASPLPPDWPYITMGEAQALIAANAGGTDAPTSRRLTAPNGDIYEETIDNNGTPHWEKIITE